MIESAIVLAEGHFRTGDAKTAHGLVRGPSRWKIRGVIDSECAGADAGTLLDGRARGIPVFATLEDALARLAERPAWCVVGVATHGGRLPDALRDVLLRAANAGVSIVNGLHELVADDETIRSAAARSGARIVDLRRPRPVRELAFWHGEALRLPMPRIAVLGTDCALGKRTTCQLLVAECRARGWRAEMIYTGQTGWMQGVKHGFILDATPNDFVAGELERALVACAREERPELVFLEGQSALRNPSGPCGAELLLSAGARHVVLQHAPARRFFDGAEELGCEIPPLAEELELLRFYGAEALGVTLNTQGLTAEAAARTAQALERELGLPVVLPLVDGVARIVERIGALLPMKIDKVETWSDRIPLTRPYTIAYERVDAVELHFVRLHAGAHVGLGSASPLPEVTGESAAACREAMRTRDVLDLLADTRGRTPAARAAFDMALYDLKAKSAGKPLVEFLGREHAELPTSITIGIKDSAEEVMAEAEEYVGRGFRCLKIKIGNDLQQDLERLHKLRAHVGDGVRIRVDANQGYRAEDCVQLFARVQHLDIEFVEQPLPPARDGELGALSEKERERLALDESLLSYADAQRLAGPKRLCGIFNIKLMKCGGIAPALAIARVAERAGIALMWGCSDESRLGIAAALHAAFATRATKYLDLDGHLDLARDPARGGFTIEEGVMRLSDGPGLGVELERDA